MNKEDVYHALQDLSRHQNSPTLEIATILKTVTTTSGESSSPGEFIELLQQLEFDKRLVINDDNTITTTHYFLNLYIEYYSNLHSGRKTSFPSVNTAPKSLPNSLLHPIDVSGLFTLLASTSGLEAINPEHRGKLFSVRFSGNLPAIVFPVGVPLNELLAIATTPVRRELDKKEELARYTSKLITTRPESADLIRKIISRFTTGSSSLANMTVGSKINIALFEQLFSSMANTIFINNPDSPDKTHIMQSLELLLSLLQYCTELLYGEKKAANAKEALYEAMGRPPYIFTMGDILRFKDSNGILLTDTCDRSFISSTLKEMLTPQLTQTLADLIIVSPENSENCYILADKVLSFVMDGILSVREKISDELHKEWLDLRMDFQQIKEREQPAAFEKKLNQLLKNFAPELHWLLFSNTFWHVYFTHTQKDPSFGKTWACFDGMKLQPLSKILNLYSQIIYAGVLKELPASYRLPVVSWFMKVLSNFKKKRKNAPEFSPNEHLKAPESSKNFKRMEGELLPGSRSLDDELAFLSDKWNILIEKNAHDNLLIDTNELIKDYFRREIQRTHSYPSDISELYDHAERVLSRHLSSDQIRNKKALMDYIALYLFKLMKRTEM
ncbi:MAG: hypothetical protein IIW10_01045 [Spirochaetaceae bacterium]|nr:hypothetical protein [Spirochaetaceae bacterium]